MSTINFAEPIQKPDVVETTEVKPQPPKKKKHTPVLSIISFIIVIALSIGAILIIRTCILSPYVIPSSSMDNTIQIDDHILAEQIFKYTKDPIRQGDIITFIDPKDTKLTLIKRVIATGGQTIDLKNGIVYVDGQPLNEPYINGVKTEAAEYTEENTNLKYPYTVPDNYVWVMGDNRGNSADSRVFGPVPLDSITGRAICIYWPFEHIKALK